jgi:hypothetical protein
MVDPLSVTSLGITLCQGCLRALSAWRSFDDDLISALQAIEDLSGTLSVLHVLIGSSNATSLEVSSLKDKVGGCEAGIAALQEFLKTLERRDLPKREAARYGRASSIAYIH